MIRGFGESRSILRRSMWMYFFTSSTVAPSRSGQVAARISALEKTFPVRDVSSSRISNPRGGPSFAPVAPPPPPPADPPRRGSLRLVPPHYGLDARLQFSQIEGLGDVVVGAEPQPREFVPRGIAYRDHDYRYAAEFAQRLHH